MRDGIKFEIFINLYFDIILSKRMKEVASKLMKQSLNNTLFKYASKTVSLRSKSILQKSSSFMKGEDGKLDEENAEVALDGPDITF